MLVTTPVHLRILLAEPAICRRVDLLLSRHRTASASLAREAEVRFAAPLHEIYGCSEAGSDRRATHRRDRGMAMSRRHHPAAGRRRHLGVRRADRGGNAAAGCDRVARSERGSCLLGRIADMVNVAGKRTSLAHLNHHLNAIDGVRTVPSCWPTTTGDTVSRLVAVRRRARAERRFHPGRVAPPDRCRLSAATALSRRRAAAQRAGQAAATRKSAVCSPRPAKRTRRGP